MLAGRDDATSSAGFLRNDLPMSLHLQEMSKQVLELFLRHPADTKQEIMDAYLVGARIESFLTKFLPQHVEGSPLQKETCQNLLLVVRQHLDQLEADIERMAVFTGSTRRTSRRTAPLAPATMLYSIDEEFATTDDHYSSADEKTAAASSSSENSSESVAALDVDKTPRRTNVRAAEPQESTLDWTEQDRCTFTRARPDGPGQNREVHHRTIIFKPVNQARRKKSPRVSSSKQQKNEEPERTHADSEDKGDANVRTRAKERQYQDASRSARYAIPNWPTYDKRNSISDVGVCDTDSLSNENATAPKQKHKVRGLAVTRHEWTELERKLGRPKISPPMEDDSFSVDSTLSVKSREFDLAAEPPPDLTAHWRQQRNRNDLTSPKSEDETFLTPTRDERSYFLTPPHSFRVERIGMRDFWHEIVDHDEELPGTNLGHELKTAEEPQDGTIPALSPVLTNVPNFTENPSVNSRWSFPLSNHSAVPYSQIHYPKTVHGNDGEIESMRLQKRRSFLRTFLKCIRCLFGYSPSHDAINTYK